MSAPFLSIILSFVKIFLQQFTPNTVVNSVINSYGLNQMCFSWWNCPKPKTLRLVMAPPLWWWLLERCWMPAPSCCRKVSASGDWKIKKVTLQLNFFFSFFKSKKIWKLAYLLVTYSRIISIFFVSCSLFLCAFWIHALDMECRNVDSLDFARLILHSRWT